MSGRARQAIVPAYILLCILLGGSSQGVWGNMILQLLAVGLIGWSAFAPRATPLSRPAKALFLVTALTLLLVIAQLVPMPPDLWAALPGRTAVADGFRQLGMDLPWLPISVAPYETMAAILALLPPLAVLSAMLLADAYRPRWLAYAVLGGTLAAVLLGALQVSGPANATSPWYLYQRTNHGLATGFFANSNHMATLLIVSLALLLALVGELRKRSKDTRAASGFLLLAIAGALVLIMGIVLNGSLAVLLLGPAVLVAGATMLLRNGKRLRMRAAAFAALAAAAMLAVYLSPLQDKLTESNSTSFASRQKMWANTLPAITEHWVFGSGVGTFEPVYRRYEDHAEATRIYVNHAHNDYLEVALETGLPGILLLLYFLLWWAGRAQAIWRSPASSRYAQAATIASAAILLHSIVDYPLRTTALSAIMAALLAIMAQPRSRETGQPDDLWPTRHATI